MEKYYNEIDKILKEYENGKSWHSKSITWVADRIEWCWKWKKITSEQTEEFSNRVVTILENN